MCNKNRIFCHYLNFFKNYFIIYIFFNNRETIFDIYLLISFHAGVSKSKTKLRREIYKGFTEYTNCLTKCFNHQLILFVLFLLYLF